LAPPTLRTCFPQIHDFTGLSFFLHSQHLLSSFTRIPFPHLLLTRSVNILPLVDVYKEHK
jgi:hypothetical protein